MASIKTSLASVSSPATRTTVGLGPIDLAREVVLKALTTCAVGSAVASSLAAELSLGPTREVVKSTGFVMSTSHLVGQLLAVALNDFLQGRIETAKTTTSPVIGA